MPASPLAVVFMYVQSCSNLQMLMIYDQDNADADDLCSVKEETIAQDSAMLDDIVNTAVELLGVTAGSIRVLVPNRSSLNGLSAGSLVSTSLRADATIVEENNFGIDETSDVLRVPQFSEEAVYDLNKESTGDDYAAAVSLKPTQQAVVAAQCLLIEKSTTQDELQILGNFVTALFFQTYSLLCIISSHGGLGGLRWQEGRQGRLNREDPDLLLSSSLAM
ncbi:hypothetical protein Drorol1_Dr00025010 [Drosera rotundifolia]